MAYAPTTWVGGVTKVGPTNLNHLEGGVQAAAAVADAATTAAAAAQSTANAALPTPAGTNGQFLKKVGGVWVPTSFAVTDIPTASIDQTYMAAGNRITAGAMASGPPGSPVTGDIWIATAVDGNGTAWMFRYDSTQTTYKWVFVGGAPVFAAVGTSETSASTTYTALATALSITLARGGDYQIEVGAWATPPVAISTLFASFAVGATAASDNWGLQTEQFDASSPRGTTGGSRLSLQTAVAAAATIAAQYRTTTGTGQWGNRWLRIVPVRVI